jgi:putative protease
VKSVQGNSATIDLRSSIARGDRLRPESATGREEEAFTVSQLSNGSGESIAFAQAGAQVYLACPKPLHPGDRLFKVGTKSEPAAAIWNRIKKEVPPGLVRKPKFAHRQEILDDLERHVDLPKKRDEKLIVKTDSTNDLVKALQSSASMVLMSATRNNLERIARQKFSPSQMQKLGFSLPAIIPESEIQYFRAAVGWFIKKGFLLWEINNWGHFDLAGTAKGIRLIAGSRLNLRNSAAFAQALVSGCRWSVVCVEATNEELKALAEKRFVSGLVVMVYCWPPLFTSRLIPTLDMNRPFLSARHEVYQLTTKAGRAEIYADRPVSWLEQLPVLRSFGYCNFMVDVSEGPAKRPQLGEALKGFAASRSPTGYSLFNIDRKP